MAASGSRQGAGLPPEVLEERARLVEVDPAPSSESRSDNGLWLAKDFLYGRSGPVSSRRITLNHRYEMRLDGLIAFANLLSLAPILSAKRYARCRNPLKAKFAEEQDRRHYAGWVMASAEAWNFGWQAQVTQFGYINPGWKYIDIDGEAKEVWPHEDIPMLAWEPFVNLRPEDVDPDWDATGHFNGIRMAQGSIIGPMSIPLINMPAARDGGSTGKKVPLNRSLWIVNQRDAEFGSIWGRPRTAYAFKFWRAYEMTLKILEHAAEYKGDPLTIIYYPDGSTPQGRERKEVPNQIIAEQMVRRAKAGTKLAMPSEVHDTEGGGKIPKWKIEHINLEDKLDTLVNILEYLDTMKMRSMGLAEQGAIEGKGGSSSRNVAAVFGNRNAETTYSFQAELDRTENRYMLPYLCEMNIPSLRDEPVEMVTRPPGDDNAGLLADLVRSAANSEGSSLPINWAGVLEELGVSTLEPEAIAELQKKMLEKASEPDTTEIKPDNSGNAGREEGTGFYYRARPWIDLSDDDVFADAVHEMLAVEDEVLLASLPATRAYDDPTVVAQTRILRKLWFDLLSKQYEDFAQWIERGEDDVSLSDADLADEDPEKRKESVARRIVESWRFSQKKLYEKTVERTTKAITKVFARAGSRELGLAGLDENAWDPSEKNLAKWIAKHSGTMISSVERKTRKDLRAHLLSEMKQDKTPKQIAASIREKFSTFPDWRADLIAREETSQVYRAATLFAAEAAGIKQAQALDARLGPTDHPCEERDGALFSIKQAWIENAKEHVNGTLVWRLLPVTTTLLEIKRVVPDEGDDDWVARTDVELGVIYLKAGFSLADAGPYLVQAVDYYVKTLAS